MRGIVALLAASGCTTLGPMPSTTGVSAVPAAKPGFEVQLGAVPAYHLSDATQDGAATGTGQAGAVFEPDRLLGVPGLVAGARLFGQGSDTLFEPLLGYRRQATPELAWMLVGYGTKKSASERLASYDAHRYGAELGADARITSIGSWVGLHVQLSAALTRIVADGTYCVDADGLGKDCDEDMPAANTVVDGEVEGFFPSATAAFAVDVGRGRTTWFHGLRVALMLSAGRMPSVVNGVQEDDATYFTLGGLATLGIGE